MQIYGICFYSMFESENVKFWEYSLIFAKDSFSHDTYSCFNAGYIVSLLVYSFILNLHKCRQPEASSKQTKPTSTAQINTSMWDTLSLVKISSSIVCDRRNKMMLKRLACFTAPVDSPNNLYHRCPHRKLSLGRNFGRHKKLHAGIGANDSGVVKWRFASKVNVATLRGQSVALSIYHCKDTKKNWFTPAPYSAPYIARSINWTLKKRKILVHLEYNYNTFVQSYVGVDMLKLQFILCDGCKCSTQTWCWQVFSGFSHAKKEEKVSVSAAHIYTWKLV